MRPPPLKKKPYHLFHVTTVFYIARHGFHIIMFQYAASLNMLTEKRDMRTTKQNLKRKTVFIYKSMVKPQGQRSTDLTTLTSSLTVTGSGVN